jgi:tetratricopeptide (TPR) repeat protein
MRRLSAWVCGAAMAALTGTAAHAAAHTPAEAADRLTTLERQLAADTENLRLGAEYRQLAIAASANDRAIRFIERLADRPDAGPNTYLTLAFAYVDKVPISSAMRQLTLGRDALSALSKSIERRPSDIAFLVRGIVNLYFDNLVFHRTARGVADLEHALSLAQARGQQAVVGRILVSLGDGYWRLNNPAKAREIWRDGLTRFPNDEMLRARAAAPDPTVRGLIAHALDPDVRVDTSLRELFPDVPQYTVTSSGR